MNSSNRASLLVQIYLRLLKYRWWSLVTRNETKRKSIVELKVVAASAWNRAKFWWMPRVRL